MNNNIKTGVLSCVNGPRLPAYSKLGLVLLASSVSALTANAQELDASPCFQELDQQRTAEPMEAKPSRARQWFARNARDVFRNIGARGGDAIAKELCDEVSSEHQARCRSLGQLGGSLLGSKLGEMLSEAEKSRYQEASYKVALTGRPESLTLGDGCIVVEPTSDETFEERQIALAFDADVAPPSKLRTIAAPYVHPASVHVSNEPARGNELTTVEANVPTFVMGTTSDGQWLLLGHEDPDEGFVGAGYVDAQGWVQAPDDAAPALIANAGEQIKLVTLAVDVACRDISSSLRIESTNQLETFAGKVCRLPNGISETE